jgi:hypothetical protein
MKQKRTLFMLIILLLGSALPVNSAVPPFEKQSARGIAKDQFQPFLEEQEKNSLLCVIQNDNDTAWYYLAGFDSGTGFAVYMDPAKCSANPTYPFQITEVGFPIHYRSLSSWSQSPVHLQVSIRQVIQSNKCLGPDTLTSLFSQSFTVPIDSSYSTLGRPMILSLNQPYSVSQPFFLEIKYLDHLVANDTLPSLLMDQSVASPDTCNNWALWTDGYHKWSDFWEVPIPGSAIIRAGGYPNAGAVEEEEGVSIPQDIELYQNHPNPFNSETLLRFNLKRPSLVTLVLYNVMGQKVRTLAQGHFRAGLTSVSWDGKDEKGDALASGIYFCQLKAGEASQTKRMLLLK